jgi:HAD superfamily hydrolase (TIGR01509 family)
MKAIIFDFYGTLFSDTALHEEAWQQFIQEVLGYQLSETEFAKIHGRTNHLTMERLLNRPLSKEEGETFSNRKEAIYREIVLEKEHDQLIEGVTEFFDLLQQKGYSMNIATASPRVNVAFYFDYFQLNRWFDFEKVVYDNGTLNSKPAPDYYVQAAKNINANPQEMVVFEDSPIGLQGAANAQAKQIIAVSTNGNHQKLEETGVVDFVIDDFRDERLIQLFS